MQRLAKIDPNHAPENAVALLAAVKSKMGMIPNLMATLANAPAALEAYLSMSDALGQGTLSAQLREQLALAVAGKNQCQYCASAHTMLGKHAGLNEDQLTQCLMGEAGDQQTQAALSFALAMVENRGQVNDQALADIRAAGYGDGEIVEIIAHVALNIFTNYLNNVAHTDIDFPLVSLPGR